MKGQVKQQERQRIKKSTREAGKDSRGETTNGGRGVWKEWKVGKDILKVL